MGRKNEILAELLCIILSSLYRYCNENYEGSSAIKLEIDLKFRGELIASAIFDVSVGILELGTAGTAEYPPTPDIVEFRLNTAKIKALYGTRGKELNHVKDALNLILVNYENEILTD